MIKPVFTLLWFEDNPDALKSQRERVEAYLRQQNLEPSIIQEENAGKLTDHLEKSNPDIIVIDQNLPDGKGSDLVSQIRKNHRLTDVLFYSAVSSDVEAYRESVGYEGFVKIVDGKEDVADELIELIDRGIRRLQDVVVLRGLVVTRVIDLELQINTFLSRYFGITQGKKADQFHNFLLENMYPYEGKCRSTNLILTASPQGLGKKFKKLLKSLPEIGKQRNYVAHCKVHPTDPSILVSIGEHKSFKRADLNKLLRTIDEAISDLDALSTLLSKEEGQ